MTIEFAPHEGVEKYRATADRFMLLIFNLQPGSYLLSDESSVRDFNIAGDEFPHERATVRQRVRHFYGVDVNDIEGGNLLAIFKRIAEGRRL